MLPKAVAVSSVLMNQCADCLLEAPFFAIPDLIGPSFVWIPAQL